MMMQLTKISDLIVSPPKTNILYYHFFPLKQIILWMKIIQICYILKQVDKQKKDNIDNR